MLSETHEFVGEATHHAVEDGSEVTDHVILDPVRLTLEAMITNAPITEEDPFGVPVGRYASPMYLDVKAYEPPFVPTPGAIFSAIGGAVRS